MPSKFAILMLTVTLATSYPRIASGEEVPPETYPLDMPVATRFCVPIRGTFAQASRTESVFRGQRIRHRRNGGFGLPVEQPGAPRHLVHTGADIGWLQVRQPVFSVANGIVRHSAGPIFKRAANEPEKPTEQMPWGNLIVIEHRLDESTYITSVYGHLGGDRRVKVGDRVVAGQPIGTIGRKHYRINGGYDPHLHFGIRMGRKAEPGAVILDRNNGWLGPRILLANVNSKDAEFACQSTGSFRVQLTSSDKRWNLRFIDGRATGPASMLWDWERPGFAIEGYAPNTDGWYDPIKFLKNHDAVSAPNRLRRR